MATDAEARAAIARMAEQAEAARSKNGTIAAVTGRRVSVVLDGDGSGMVTAYRGAFEPVLNARVKVTRVAGTRFWKIVGVADDSLAATDDLPYDFENQGEKVYFPIALEAINDGSYNLDAALGMTVYNFKVYNSDNELVYTASQTLDFAASVPVSDSRWSVVYGDASTGVLDIYDFPSTATPDGEWVDAVNGLLNDVADAIPVLAVRLDAGMTTWGNAWRALKRGYQFGNKKIIRLPMPVQPTAGTVITDAYYQTIEEDGTPVVSRPKMNFIGTGTTVVTVTDDGVDTTDITIDSTGLVKENFIELDDAPATYFGHEAELVRVNATENGLEFVDPATIIPDDFTDLSDTPSDYTGHANKLVTVKGDETGVEFTTPPTPFNINSLTEEPSIVSGDFIPFYDTTAGAMRKIDLDDFPAGGAGDFTDLGDVPAAYTGHANKLVSVKNDETGLEFIVPPVTGAEDFTDLGDVPSAYTGHGEKLVAVKLDETGLEFIDAPTGSGAIDVTDGTTIVSPASAVNFDPTFFDVTDEGGGTAGVTLHDGGGALMRVEVPLETQTLGANGTITFDVTPYASAGYTDLIVRIKAKSTGATTKDGMQMLLNGTAVAADNHIQATGGENNAASSAEGDTLTVINVPGASSEANAWGYGVVELFEYLSAVRKNVFVQEVAEFAADNQAITFRHRVWQSTAAITSIKFQTDNDPTDLLLAGSTATLYGVKHIAMGGSLDVSDGVTTVDPATSIEFDSAYFDVTDGGSGQAQVTLHEAGGTLMRTEIPIYENELGSSAASIAVSGIPQDGDDLVIYLTAKSTDTGATSGSVAVSLNGDSTATNYFRQNIAGQNNATTAGEVNANTILGLATSHASVLSNSHGQMRFYIPRYAETTIRKMIEVDYSLNIVSGEMIVGKLLVSWNKASGASDAITSITLTPSAGSFAVGTKILVCKVKQLSVGGGSVPVSTANVSNPPTDAELDTAFGTPATVGAGFAALVNDNNADANNYLVLSNGTSWWYQALTKAV